MKAIIIPGYDCSSKCVEYKMLKTAFEKKDYEVVIHEPKWELSMMADWVEDLCAEVIKHSEVMLLGFSVGGMISLLTSTKQKVDRLIACSPSGYFPEYQHLFQPDDTNWTDEHLKDFASLSSKKLFKDIQVKRGNIIVGERELTDWPDFKQWTSDLRKETSWPLTVVAKTGHDLAKPNYQIAVDALL